MSAALPDMPALDCPECGGKLVLKESRFGLFYGCTNWPACDCTHGAHADGKPKGTPANAATRKARIMAHAAFDPIWQSGIISRKLAYEWLACALSLTPEQCHIGMFDIDMCGEAIDACEAMELAICSEPRS